MYEQDARTVRVLPSIEFATDLGLLYQEDTDLQELTELGLEEWLKRSPF